MPPESWIEDRGQLIARNVSAATLTPFLPPPGRKTGAAVIIAPGGAFVQLSMESEGWSVPQWLAARGVAAFVLKYRVLPTPSDPGAYGRFVQGKIADPIGGKASCDGAEAAASVMVPAIGKAGMIVVSFVMAPSLRRRE